MSYFITTLFVLCSTIPLIYAEVRLLKCGNATCGQYEYCELASHTCVPCSEICDKSSTNFSPKLCSSHCENYEHRDENYEHRDAITPTPGIYPEIKNIYCISYNFEELRCSWDLEGALPVAIKASTLVDKDGESVRLECFITGIGPQDQCKVQDEALIMYPSMTLLLEMYADGKAVHNETYYINQAYIAVPGHQEAIEALAGRTSVQLSVTPNRHLWSSEVPKLLYEIQYIDPRTKLKTDISNIEVEWWPELRGFVGNIVNITGLEEETKYKFAIRSRFATSNRKNLDLWQEEFKVVKTLPPRETFAVRGTKSLTLHWTPDERFRIGQPIDLVYQIQYKDPWTDEAIERSNIFVTYTSDGKWVGNTASMKDLEEDTSYHFTIRSRLKDADEQDPQSWTTEFKGFRTLAAVPETPEVPPGFFQSHNIPESGKRNVVVYWMELQPIQWNGRPEHLYRIEDDTTSFTTKATKMDFMGVKAEEELTFKLLASNRNGSSEETIITIPAASRLLEAPRAKQEYIGNGMFRISWQPWNSSEVTSITVGWCEDPHSVASDCDGSFQWKSVDGFPLSVDIYREDIYFSDGNCANAPFLFAVNSATSSSGLIEIERKEMFAVRGTKSITLHWTPAYCFRLREPIDLVYEVRYVDPWTNKSMVKSNFSVLYTYDGTWLGNSAHVGDLEEDTTYNFTVRGRLWKAVADNPHSWTLESKTFKTLAAVPDSPEVPPGLFQTHELAGGTRDVVVYWKALLPVQWNGPPEYFYRLQQERKVGFITRATKMEFIDVKADEDLKLKFQAKNGIGSSEKTIIIIPASSRLLKAVKAKKQYVGNGIFRISWEPSGNSDVTSYTVAWCKERNNVSNDCNKSFDWKVVNGSAVSVDIYRKGFDSLDVDIADVPFSVAVNTATSSSGLIPVLE